MNFYIDESGNTGNNLFDEAQPILYYGVIHSQNDLDISIDAHIRSARAKLGVERLHSTELGAGGLMEIVPELLKAQCAAKAHFSVYQVKKHDLAAICFFDQVFDQGMNPSVPWSAYWTPLKYILLLKISQLFDPKTLEMAWKARINKNDREAEAALCAVCEILIARLLNHRDLRFKEIATDALTWATKNPNKIQYNCSTKSQALDIAPNVIGFQFVMHGIARCLGSDTVASKIIVDQQSQFNSAQKRLSSLYGKMRNFKRPMGVGLPLFDLTNMPQTPLSISGGNQSVGLEVVDIYLWIAKRILTGKPLPPELIQILNFQINDGVFDQMSLQGIVQRWSPFFENELPQIDEFPEEQLKAGVALYNEMENRRLSAMKELK